MTSTLDRRGTSRPLAAIALVIALIAGMFAADAANAAKKRGGKVSVMTRNLFLGADLTPALEAGDPETFIEANGGILREVMLTDFPRRARALAAEIRDRRPDLVGLQEVALWRTATPADLDPVFSGPTATTVRVDFLRELMDRINRRKRLYKVAVVQNEFDFEAPADENDVDNDGVLADPFDDAELNGRLTMRDAIIIRRSDDVRFRRPRSGNFSNLLEVTVSGIPVDVTRGWTRVEAKVGRSPWFSFTNTHLEAFDDETETPSIRQLQATEVGGPDGYAESGRPTVLVGDLNSDDDTVAPNDRKAYNALLGFGWRSRSTDEDSCCVSDLFTSPPSEFDHHIDHVMTDTPRKVKLLGGGPTGLAKVGGIYPSDHGGMFSKLRIRK